MRARMMMATVGLLAGVALTGCSSDSPDAATVCTPQVRDAIAAGEYPDLATPDEVACAALVFSTPAERERMYCPAGDRDADVDGDMRNEGWTEQDLAALEHVCEVFYRS